MIETLKIIINRILCLLFGHKKKVVYRVYQNDKRRWRGRDRQHKRGGRLDVKTTYRPFFVIYCSRCNTKLKTIESKKKLNKDQVKEYTEKIMKKGAI